MLCKTRRYLCKVRRPSESMIFNKQLESHASTPRLGITSKSPDIEESIHWPRQSWTELILGSCSLLGQLPEVHGFPWRLVLFLVITTSDYILHGVIHKSAVQRALHVQLRKCRSCNNFTICLHACVSFKDDSGVWFNIHGFLCYIICENIRTVCMLSVL
jgi:hypothetical protein